MEGSRTNPNAKKDIFQDYDIVYVVQETKSFIEDKNWIDRFGKRLYMQYPDENCYYEHDTNACYGWLIQFSDGNRLDLHVCVLSHALKEIDEDKLCKILLDKNNCLPNIPKETDETHWVKKNNRTSIVINFIEIKRQIYLNTVFYLKYTKQQLFLLNTKFHINP